MASISVKATVARHEGLFNFFRKTRRDDCQCVVVVRASSSLATCFRSEWWVLLPSLHSPLWPVCQGTMFFWSSSLKVNDTHPSFMCTRHCLRGLSAALVGLGMLLLCRQGLHLELKSRALAYGKTLICETLQPDKVNFSDGVIDLNLHSFLQFQTRPASILCESVISHSGKEYFPKLLRSSRVRWTLSVTLRLLQI